MNIANSLLLSFVVMLRFTGVSFQRTWRSLLKGARLIHKENNRVMLYQKPGSYDQAIYDFYSFDPSYVHMVSYN